MVQLPVPLHAPDHPESIWPEPGVAVRVTLVPGAKFAVQVPVLQLIPAGLLVTVPVPVTLTDNWLVPEKAALTDFAAVMLTAQVPVPLHAPPQFENIAPEPGVAVKVTVTPNGKFALQVPGQLIPAGLLVTVPLPASLTVSV
jgi:hypothetical protein